MGKNYFILIAGDGESSRANTEALLEDYFYANGDGATLVIPFKESASKSQKIAVMYAQEKKQDFVYFCPESADTSGLPGASLIVASSHASESPLDDAIAFIGINDTSVLFVLGLEGDASKESVYKAREAGIHCFNLCEGLLAVTVWVPPTESTFDELIAENAKNVLNEMAAAKERELEQGLSTPVIRLSEAVISTEFTDLSLRMPKEVVEAIVNLVGVLREAGMVI